MEEVKYFRRFHQANMSHLLSTLNKSKWSLIVIVFTKLVFDANILAAIGVLISFVIMAIWTSRLEQSKISNDRAVIITIHFIIATLILSNILSTINTNGLTPDSTKNDVIIIFVMTLEWIKTIEPDYVKSTKMFMIYWGLYLGILWVYYNRILIEQILIFGAIFLMVGSIIQEKYNSNNTQTEIFYDFHNEPVIIYEDESIIKANYLFVKYFGRQVKCK